VSLRRGQLRTLRGIECELAASEPDLDELFTSFASEAGQPQMPYVENIGARHLKMLTRLLPPPTVSERVQDWCAQNWVDP
jgi:hypothetical protein